MPTGVTRRSLFTPRPLKSQRLRHLDHPRPSSRSSGPPASRDGRGGSRNTARMRPAGRGRQPRGRRGRAPDGRLGALVTGSILLPLRHPRCPLRDSHPRTASAPHPRRASGTVHRVPRGRPHPAAPYTGPSPVRPAGADPLPQAHAPLLQCPAGEPARSRGPARYRLRPCRVHRRLRVRRPHPAHQPLRRSPAGTRRLSRHPPLHAVRHKKIRENTVKLAERPANPITQVDERTLPSYEEISTLAKEIGHRLEPSVWLMACCGLRIGESLGVFSEDILDGTVRCRRQVVRIKNPSGKYVALYAPLKHRKEGEWGDIPAPVHLEPLIERLPIRNQAGGTIHPDLFHQSWDRALKRLGL